MKKPTETTQQIHFRCKSWLFNKRGNYLKQNNVFLKQLGSLTQMVSGERERVGNWMCYMNNWILKEIIWNVCEIS